MKEEPFSTIENVKIFDKDRNEIFSGFFDKTGIDNNDLTHDEMNRLKDGISTTSSSQSDRSFYESDMKFSTLLSYFNSTDENYIKK